MTEHVSLSCSWAPNGARPTVRLVAVVDRMISAVNKWSAKMASSGTWKTAPGTVAVYLIEIVMVVGTKFRLLC